MISLAAATLLGGIATALAYAYSSKKQTDVSQKAINSSDLQNKQQLALMDSQFQQQMEFSDKQHADQMDFANRQLADNSRIADMNFNLQKDVFNYQKQLNATQMEREDSAMRRQMQDLQAAGLSPLAAVGGSGAGSAALSSGAAPQYDMSGVNAAAGQYADFARQYAQLKIAASQNYMNSRSSVASAHNASITGSRLALAQMKSDMNYKGLSLATQAFNSYVNNKYTQEQLDYLKDKHDWESINGFRNTTWQSAIITALEKVADKYDLSKKAEEKVNTIISDFKQTLKDSSVSATESLVQVIENINKAEEIKEDSKKMIIAALMKYAVLPSVEQIRKNQGK